MAGYVFHCTPCGFAHSGDCIAPPPASPEEQEAMDVAIKEASLDELKRAYLSIKAELFRRMSQP